MFGGEVLKYEALVEDEAYVSRSNDPDPKVPFVRWGKFPLSTYLADMVRGIMAVTMRGARCRIRCAKVESRISVRVCRASANCWSKPSAGAAKYYLVCYPFEGRLGSGRSGC